MSEGPTTAMILAAGLGTRLRPLTATRPKPLVEVAGKPIIDYGLDKLRAAGVSNAVVNLHYLGDQLQAHLQSRKDFTFQFSHEPDGPLETGGGTQRALPMLGSAPFFLINGDSFWIDGAEPNFSRMSQLWDGSKMDILLLLAATVDAVGYKGLGDFDMDADGRLRRRAEGRATGFVYAGAAIFDPAIFASQTEANYSLNKLFDLAIERDRLYGLRLDGIWLHISTPPDVGSAESAISHSVA